MIRKLNILMLCFAAAMPAFAMEGGVWWIGAFFGGS